MQLRYRHVITQLQMLASISIAAMHTVTQQTTNQPSHLKVSLWAFRSRLCINGYWCDSRNATVGRQSWSARQSVTPDDRSNQLALTSTLSQTRILKPEKSLEKRGGTGQSRLAGLRSYHAVISMPLRPRGSEFFRLAIIGKLLFAVKS